MYHFWSYHTGGAQFGLVDGSVQFLSHNVDKTIIYGLASRCAAARCHSPAW
jgi:prepilin-type processing-associated H-X9-DG protein